jgi:hypothetical protein
MSGEPVKLLDPSLLLEASRVMNAAGPDYANAARQVSDWALKNISKADPETRAAIIGDAAALRLRVPGHYAEALDLLTNIDSQQCPDPKGRLLMLRALANGQKYKALKSSGKASPDERSGLQKQIRDDLTIAFSRDDTLKRDNQGYWAKSKRAEVGGFGVQDDLQKVWCDDEEFRKLVALPAAADAAGKPTADGSAKGDSTASDPKDSADRKL